MTQGSCCWFPPLIFMQLGFPCSEHTAFFPFQMCTTSPIKLSLLALGVIKYTVLLVCRAVYVAIPVCVVGVVFITQPSWLGGGTHPRSALGIILAIGQVGHKLCIAIINITLHYITSHHLTSQYITQYPGLSVREMLAMHASLASLMQCSCNIFGCWSSACTLLSN